MLCTAHNYQTYRKYESKVRDAKLIVKRDISSGKVAWMLESLLYAACINPHDGNTLWRMGSKIELTIFGKNWKQISDP